MWESSTFLGALTPKFYVALTGTSSLISGLILIFEWWYFRKFGTSFIERVSLGGSGGSGEAEAPREARVWRNPLALLRGAEYARLWAAARRAPLTRHDMSLSAQEQTAWFTLAGGGPAEEALARACSAREAAARVAEARRALALRPDCAAALLLLAEEDAPTVLEAERLMKRAWRGAELAVRASGAAGANAEARRAALVAAAAKRRCGVCARRLGRLREAARLFRELARDAPHAPPAQLVHENLLEVLLEQRAYADAAALLARLEETGAPRSAALLYSHALLRARAANLAPHHHRDHADLAALQALRVAIEFNPFVPMYLLELRPLTLPPEHVARRGDSEALAYAFFHLRHWQAADALPLLEGAWRESGACVPPSAPVPPAPAASGADAELLPAHVEPAGGRALPCAAAACCGAALLALLAHRWPDAAALALQAVANFTPRDLFATL